MEVVRFAVVAGRFVVELAAFTTVRGRALTGAVRDCMMLRLTVLVLAMAFFVGAFSADGLDAARLTEALTGARLTSALVAAARVMVVVFVGVFLAAGFFAVSFFAAGFFADAFFAMVLAAVGFIVARPFSVASSIAFIAVWIDLMPFIAVRLLV